MILNNKNICSSNALGILFGSLIFITNWVWVEDIHAASVTSQPKNTSATAPSAEALQKFEAQLFEKNEYGVRQGLRTDGVLVVKDGKKIFEQYARGYTQNKKHILWSSG